MKIILGLLIVLDFAVLALFILGVYFSVKAGGRASIAFPSLGIIVAVPPVSALIFIIELGLIGATFLLYRHLQNGAVRLI